MDASFNIDKLEEILKKNPDDFATNLVLQAMYMEANEYAKAKRPLSILVPVMKKNIEDAEVTNKSTISVISVSKPVSYSLQDYKKIYKLNLESLAICHMELGDLSVALRYQEQCLRVDDKDPDSWNSYAVLLSRMDRTQDTLEAFLSALIRNPLHLNSWKNLEREYNLKQNIDNVEQISHIHHPRNNLDDAISQVARIFFSRHEYDRLFELLQRHPMKNIITDEISDILIRILIEKEKYDIAEKILEKRISNNPNDAKERWRLARVYALQEKTEQSLKTIANLKKGDPQYSESLLLQNTLNNEANPIQIVKAFVRYHSGHYDRIIFQYLTEVQIRLGTSVGDFVQSLVSGDVKKISPHDKIPGVHYVYFINNSSTFCVSSNWNLFQIRGDDPSSFSITYEKSRVHHASKAANFSDILLDGDVLLLGKKHTSSVPQVYADTSALIFGPAMKMMELEEQKSRGKPLGQRTKRPIEDVPWPYDAFVDEFLTELDK